MAINENEINISGKSYTRKDFASIYPESVDLVKKLTNRWNPQTSNESDPGVVLLKDSSFKADKLCYNIDKNILEAFMPTCTQETSMRMNCESRGYEMQYYRAAEVQLTISYCGNSRVNAFDSDSTPIAIGRFGTVVSTDDGSVSYVLIEGTQLNYLGSMDTKLAMQGTLERMTSLGSKDTVIHLINIDDNNRLYFPVPNVAQNGIFISNAGTDNSAEWVRVTNLNTIQPGNKVYKFGFDSRRGLPYVEFPDDIASLIGSGLSVLYIVTDGANGNVSANSLTKIVSIDATRNGEAYETDLAEDGPEIVVINHSSSVGGADPETIDEAYSNYKRTIGTFDSLITCRDYANFLYNTGLVSNAQASDRRDDINHSVVVVTFNEQGYSNQNYDPSSTVTASSLFIYPLNSMESRTMSGYISSFQPKALTNEMVSMMESTKSISHDYASLLDNDIFLIKNYADLDAKIVTTSKVNAYERSSIVANVQQALIERFNARNVDYGYEIPYEILLDAIQNADSRISSVSLAEPELDTWFMVAGPNAEEHSIEEYDASNPTASTNGYKYFNTVLARNIVSGRVQLFDMDTEFGYDFGQYFPGQNSTKVTSIFRITTQTTVTPATSDPNPSSSSTYSATMGDNEALQFIGPSLVEDDDYGPYGYNILYSWEPADTTKVVQVDEYYQLITGDALYIRYTDTNGNIVEQKFSEGTIIQPTGETPLAPVPQGGDRPAGAVTKEGVSKWTGNKYLKAIGAKDNLHIKKINEVTLQTELDCYWVIDNSTNTIPFVNGEYVLRDGEYFFYSDTGHTTWATVGSGTTLRLTESQSGALGQWTANKIGYSEIAQKGLDSLEGKWVRKTFDSTDGNTLLLRENSILTLVANDSVSFSDIDTSSEWWNNTDHKIQNGFLGVGSTKVSYVSNGTPGVLPAYGISNFEWKVRSRLDLSCGPEKAQKIFAGQSVVFTKSDGTTVPVQSQNTYIMTNAEINIAGGIDIDMSLYDYIEEEVVYPYSAYFFMKDQSKSVDRSNGVDYPTISLRSASPQSGEVSSVTLAVPNVGEDAIWMIYWIPDAGGEISITDTNSKISFYNGTHNTAQMSSITDRGIYNILIKSSASNEITISCTAGSGQIIIDKPRFFRGINSVLGIDSLATRICNANPTLPKTQVVGNIEGDLLSKVGLYGGDFFYYGNEISDSKAIESTDMSSPYAFFDSNNVACKFTMEEVNVKVGEGNSSIDVVRSSRL